MTLADFLTVLVRTRPMITVLRGLYVVVVESFCGCRLRGIKSSKFFCVGKVVDVSLAGTLVSFYVHVTISSQSVHSGTSQKSSLLSFKSIEFQIDYKFNI